MKNAKQFPKKLAGIIGMMCLLVTLFSSCLKDHDNYIPQPPVAHLSVVNASPDSQSLDFFLDQNKTNVYPIPYRQGIDYVQAFTGNRNATFYIAGTQQKIKSDTITLQADKYYSLFLSNMVSKPDALLLTDSISKPAPGMATVRLVNLSPDAPAIDLAVNGGAVLVSNKSYKGYSLFVPVTGNATLEIRQAGTSTLIASLKDFAFQSGAVYTVWLQGLASATDYKKLSAGVQKNAWFY